MTNQSLDTQSQVEAAPRGHLQPSKGLRLSAILCLAILMAPGARADCLVSGNVVGYVQVAVPPSGQSLIANPLNGTNNNLNTILPLPATAENVTVYRWNYASQTLMPTPYDSFTQEWSDDPVVNPGEGFFIQNGDASPLNLIFVGEVSEGNLTVPIPYPGFSYVASKVPQARPLGTSGQANTLQFPATDGDAAYLWNLASQNFEVYSFFDIFWDPYDPAIGVAQGFAVTRGAPGNNWTRNFVVSCATGPDLSIALRRSDRNVTLTWSAPSNWALQAANDPEGPWTSMSGQASPYTFLPDAAKKFFRLAGTPVTNYTITVSNCCTPIANQLNHLSGNTLANIMPTLPCDARFYKWDNASQNWVATTYSTASGWANGSITLNPGEGAFLCPCVDTTFTLTFTGTVPTPSLPVTMVPGNWYLFSRQTPGPGTYDNITGLAPVPNAAAFTWNCVGYTAHIFDDIDLLWNPIAPTTAVGSAMWVHLPGGGGSAPPAAPNIQCPTNSYTITVSNCCTLIANQLNHLSGNTLANIMPTLPCDARFYKWDNASQNWVATTYSTASGWANGSITLNPGEGAFLCPCVDTTFTLTFTGTVPTPSLPVTMVPGNWYLFSRQTPGPGTYDNITGLAPVPNAAAFTWNCVGYTAHIFDDIDLLWNPIAPTTAVGSAMWVHLPGGGGSAPPAAPNIQCPTNSYTITVSNCCTLIANQLNHLSGNTLANIMPALPCDARFYKWDNASQNWVATTYSTASGWANGSITLNPGEGAFLCPCVDTTFTLTFTGTVPTPSLPVTMVPGNWYLLSRQTPDPGTYDNITGLAPVPNVAAFTWNCLGYTAHSFDEFDLVWYPSAPTTAVGSAMWVHLPGGGGSAPPAAPNIQCPTNSYTITVSNCCTLIANQLNHLSGNTLANIMPTLPCDARFYKWDNASQNWVATTYSTASGWANGSITLNPGEGAFLCPCVDTTFTLTFTGTVPTPSLPVTMVPGNWYLFSRQTPGPGTYDNITGLAPVPNVAAFTWNCLGYTAHSFDEFDLVWYPSAPTTAVGSAMWVHLPGGGGGTPPAAPNIQCPTNSYTITVSNCCTLIANQLNHLSGNTLANIMPTLPCDARFYKWDNASQNWVATTYSTASGWANGSITLNPGEGAFLCPCVDTTFTLTFTGTVPTPSLPVTMVPGNWYLFSRQTPNPGTYDNITGLAPVPNAAAYTWNCVGYTAHIFDDIDLLWNPIAPTTAVGSAMWVHLPGGGGSAPPAAPNIQCPTNSYTITVSNCCTLIANQLNHLSGNTLANIMPTLPCDARFYKWDNASQNWVATTYSTASGWANGSITLNPGEGAFLCPCVDTTFTLTFTGTVPTPSLPVTMVPGNWYLFSRQTPGPGTYDNITGLAPVPNAAAFTWNCVGYTAHIFDDIDLLWNPIAPTTAVGSAMWVHLPGGGGSAPPAAPNIQCPTVACHVSANVVGYVQLSVPAAGSSLIANPLNTTNNTLGGGVLTLPPTATNVVLRKYTTGAGWGDPIYGNAGQPWSDPSVTLNPGEGALLTNGSSPLKLTFVGEVMEGSLTNPVPLGYSVRASMVPQSLPLGTSGQAGTLQFPAAPIDATYLYDAGSWTLYSFDEFDLIWRPSNPVIGVAQAFLCNKTLSADWIQNFVVSSPCGPRLAISLGPTDGSVTVTWAAPSEWQLQSAAGPDGPWTTCYNQTSPLTFLPTAPATFFRLVNPALWCRMTSTNTLLLSWHAPGYQLQKRPYSVPTWSDVPNAPVLVGDEYQVSIDDLFGWVSKGCVFPYIVAQCSTNCTGDPTCITNIVYDVGPCTNQIPPELGTHWFLTNTVRLQCTSQLGATNILQGTNVFVYCTTNVFLTSGYGYYVTNSHGIQPPPGAGCGYSYNPTNEATFFRLRKL